MKNKWVQGRDGSWCEYCGLTKKSKESTIPLLSTSDIMEKKWNVLQRVKEFTHQNKALLILTLVEELVFLPRVNRTLKPHSQPSHPLGSSTMLLAQENPCQQPLLTTLIHSTKAKHTFSRNQQHKWEDTT